MEVLPSEMGAAVGHIPNNLFCVFTAQSLIHEEPHVHPKGNPKSTVKCAFPADTAFVCSDLHTSWSMYAACVCTCMFLCVFSVCTPGCFCVLFLSEWV